MAPVWLGIKDKGAAAYHEWIIGKSVEEIDFVINVFFPLYRYCPIILLYETFKN